MYNLEIQQTASDVYHNYLEDAHLVLEDFTQAAHVDSADKMNLLWHQLHMAGGAKYVYADAALDEYSYQWLNKKGKRIIQELIEDAKASKMKNALRTLQELQKILEDKNIIH